ncbi:MAG: endolytic transglycosylase MltG [Patescibacteria group bacterium]
MKKVSGYFIITAFLIFLGLLFYLIDEIYIERVLAGKIEFQIEKGESLNSVVKKLAEAGLVRNKFITRSYLFFNGLETSVKPGLYILGPKYSVNEIFEKFNLGADLEVKVFEGWTVKEIAEALSELGVIKDSGDFLKLAKNFNNSGGAYEFLPKKKGVDLEGYLFPDTYKFERGSVDSAVEKMLLNFRKKVILKYAGRHPEELRNILIMASMLEREVKTDEDMRLVSGILWKRFESEVSLQVDAALVYIKCVFMAESESDSSGCRQLSNADKKIDSLYNTYLNKGLPPGPISNPGLRAIDAALNPIESGYWYYLSALDGRTIFSETLDEHNLNRVIYR